MEKFIKSIWTLLGLLLFTILNIYVFFDYLIEGKQPDNITVMVIILIAINLEGIFTRRKQNQNKIQ